MRVIPATIRSVTQGTELLTKVREDFAIMDRASTRALSLLKFHASAFKNYSDTLCDLREPSFQASTGNPGELFIKLTSIFFYALLNHGLLCEYFCSTVISHTSQILNNIFDRFDNEILIFKTIRQTNGNTDFFQVSAKLTWWCSRWPLIFTTSSSSPSTWATSASTSDSWWGIEFFHFDVYVNRFT